MGYHTINKTHCTGIFTIVNKSDKILQSDKLTISKHKLENQDSLCVYIYIYIYIPWSSFHASDLYRFCFQTLLTSVPCCGSQNVHYPGLTFSESSASVKKMGTLTLGVAPNKRKNKQIC